jgi:hypothetical protein
MASKCLVVSAAGTAFSIRGVLTAVEAFQNQLLRSAHVFGTNRSSRTECSESVECSAGRRQRQALTNRSRPRFVVRSASIRAKVEPNRRLFETLSLVDAETLDWAFSPE